ncbi:MAG: stalk domain-containing protein [Caldiserica bacterium]|nr:stalk domain-containing protein [Caldisericota bacterium]
MKQFVRFVLLLVLCLVLSVSELRAGTSAARAADIGTWTRLPPYESRLLCLAIDPLSPSILYAGTGGSGVFRSLDSGTTSTAVNSGLTDPWVWSLAINPVTPATLYAGTDSHGVFLSTNGGNVWTTANAGLLSLHVSSLAINPHAPTTLYAGTAGGVFRSTNGGSVWTAANAGLTNLQVSSLAINPLTPATLYAGTTGGVFCSRDGGTTWTIANAGLTNPWVWSLAIDPLTPTTLYAGTVGGVFRSTNAGTSWTAVNTGLTDLWVLALAVDPLTPTTLYAGTGNAGVFRSANGGTTWTALNAGLTDPWVWSLAVDPFAPTALYVGTGGSGIFRYDAVSSYTLTVMASPSAGGLIGRSPDASLYALGSVVTLTAIPAAGYTFTGWTGDLDSTANPVAVTMEADKTITAVYSVDSYTLTVNVSGSGSVATFPDQVTFSRSSVVQLTATPADGWEFTGWTGDLTTVMNPITLIVGGAHVVVAQFEPVAPSLASSLGIVVIGGGSVVRSPDRDLFDTTEAVELRAVPAAGWAFFEWKGDLSGNAPTVWLPMNASKSVVAVFCELPEEESWTVVLDSGANGKVTPSGTQMVKDGTPMRIELQPNVGYQIDRLVVDGRSVPLSSAAAQSYDLDPITTNHIVQCSFVVVPAVLKTHVVRLTIGSMWLTVDGQQTGLDAAPMIVNNRTLLPIRAIVEAFGGTIEWHVELRVVTIHLNGNEVSLQIGNWQGYVNGAQTAIDVLDQEVVPVIIAGRTYLPLRFVAENLGLQVEWDSVTRTVTAQG